MNRVQEWFQKYSMICSPALHILYTDPFMFSSFINHQTEEFIMKVVQGWHGKARYQQKWCQKWLIFWILRRQRSQDFRGIYGAKGGPLTKHWIDFVLLEKSESCLISLAKSESDLHLFNSPEENPAFHEHSLVYQPYCRWEKKTFVSTSTAQVKYVLRV